MPIAPNEVLKDYFLTAEKPTAAQFGTLIDSMVNKIDDRYLLGLREYDPNKLYAVGDTTIFSNALYECKVATTGPFNPPSWQVIASLGSVVFVGTWDAINNVPALQSGVGTKGYYYVVSNASPIPSQNTMLDGIDDWGVSDWVIFDGTHWDKVDNSTAPTKAADVIFVPNGDITATNVQDAIVEVRDDTDTKLATKQDLISLKPNFYPYASAVHTLSDGVISNETDGVALVNGKVFRSAIPSKAQLNFGTNGNNVNMSTDGGIGAESSLILQTDRLFLERTNYGALSILPGTDNNGDVELTSGVGNGLSITTGVVQLSNSQTTNGFVKISSDGTTEVGSATFKMSSAAINVPNLTASTVPYINASNNLASSSVTPTELGYVSGVTSSIQTQINSKQNSLGFTPVPDTRTVNGHPLSTDVTVTKTDVGLGNVVNVDTTNPANITQDSTHRFVTDAQEAIWDAKQNALGFTPVPNTRLVNGHALSADVTITKADVNLGNVVNVDTTNPANIVQDSTHRFVTDAQETTWNGKQDALGFTPVPNTRTVNGHALSADVTVTKADVNLGNVVNVDTTNPANITQDSTHRFVTDAQEATWNGKQDALGFTPVPNTRTVNGHALTADVTITKADVNLGNVVNLDTTNPANITQDSTHRFATDAEKTTWNGKVDRAGDTMLGDLQLSTTGTPANPASATSRQYVLDQIAAAPGQVKTIALPFTFFVNNGFFSVTTLNTWTRLTSSSPTLQMRVVVPPPGTIFPGTTQVSGRIVVDYQTVSAPSVTQTQGRVGLYDFTTFGTVTPVTGTDFLLNTQASFGVVTGPSFNLIGPTSPAYPLQTSRTFEIIVERTAGVAGSGITPAVNIECATLILTYS